MLWHSAATCNVSKFSSLFCIFLRNYWSDLDQTLIFVHAGTLQPIVKFQNFLTFLHFSQELLVWSWSNFDFCSCCGTLQPVVKFQKVSQFFAFFLGTTGLILINLWFLFMLWHSTANCKVSKFSHFLHFSQELLVWSWSNFDFCLCCGTLQPIVKFQNFLHFFAFFSGTIGVILIKLWFLFMLWHSAANCKVSKFSSLFCIFLKNYWSSSNIDFCSCCCILQPVAKFHNFLSFLHFS